MCCTYFFYLKMCNKLHTCYKDNTPCHYNPLFLTLLKQKSIAPMILDISGIIEKFNVYVTLAIIPRMKSINRALWLVHIFIKTLHFSLLGRRISPLYLVQRKNLALPQYNIYSENVYCDYWIIRIQYLSKYKVRGGDRNWSSLALPKKSIKIC